MRNGQRDMVSPPAYENGPLPRSAAPEFPDDFREHLHELLAWRRDVRHFRRERLPDGTLERLLTLACRAPSVGLSQPWRFVSVDDSGRRKAIRASFEACNQEALQLQSGERAALYARLKLAGLDDAPVHVAVFADRHSQQGHGLGRLTMPEMSEYSVVMAVHTLWLAARAEGIGLGWVSILPPQEIAAILDVPADWIFIGYLCIGYPAEELDTPVLEREGWEMRKPCLSFLSYR